MLNREASLIASRLKYQSGVKTDYHARMQRRWYLVDKGLLLATMVCAILMVVGVHRQFLAATFFAVSVMVNIVPTGKKQVFHDQRYRHWAGMRAMAHVLQAKLEAGLSCRPNDDATAEVVDQVEKIWRNVETDAKFLI